MRVAALTMAYNEPVWARVWSRYYGAQVGAQNCFLMDHGSDDGSTAGLDVQVERLPPTPLDEDWRAAVVGARVAELLRTYDAVVHSDVDELVITDPLRHAGLAGFAQDCRDEVVTAVGLDLQHMVGLEQRLDTGRPIGLQRRWVRFSAAMCKPVLVRRPTAWRPGFHRADAAVVFRGLYLVHLRYADLEAGLVRLARSRTQSFARTDINPHQRVSDQAFAAMMAGIAQLPRTRFTLDWTVPPLRRWLERMAAAGEGPKALAIAGDQLWPLPMRVRRLF